MMNISGAVFSLSFFTSMHCSFPSLSFPPVTSLDHILMHSLRSLLFLCSSPCSVSFCLLLLFISSSLIFHAPPEMRRTSRRQTPNTSSVFRLLCQLFVLQSWKTFVFTFSCQSLFLPLRPPVFPSRSGNRSLVEQQRHDSTVCRVDSSSSSLRLSEFPLSLSNCRLEVIQHSEAEFS